MRLLNQAALFLMTVCGASALQAEVVYNIVDYPSLENGWTVSGTITTDGTIGTLTARDITAWSFTLTNGGTTDTWSSAVIGATYSRTTVAGITATATELEIMGTPGPDQAFQLDLGYGGSGTGGEMFWTRDGSFSAISEPATDVYYGKFGGTSLFFDSANNPPGLTLTDSTNWVLAEAPSQSSATPEPGTVGLLALGIAGLAVARARRTA